MFFKPLHDCGISAANAAIIIFILNIQALMTSLPVTTPQLELTRPPDMTISFELTCVPAHTEV